MYKPGVFTYGTFHIRLFKKEVKKLMIRYHWANTLLGVSLSNDKQLRTQNFYNIDPKWILAKKSFMWNEIGNCFQNQSF